jgi:isovaleryl-CoA dehydrogenase
VVLSGSQVRPQCSGENAAVFGLVFGLEGSAPALGLVRAGSKGLSTGEAIKKTGLAPSINADLDLDEVEVPDGMVAFEGLERLRSMLSVYYMGCAAACSGALLASYEILKEWVETRVIKGKGQVFKENPLVASLIGEIGGRTALARVLTFNLARMLSVPDEYGAAGSGSIFSFATAVFKHVAEMASLALNNTMELMGSAGYSTEWNLERYWRDVKALEATVVPETAARVDMARHYFNLQRL